MNNLHDTALDKILPPSIRDNSDIKATAKAIDSGFFSVVKDIEKLAILTNIDNLPEPIIDHLLWQFHITYDEGAGLAETLNQKRALVKQALEIHKIKGTKAALERVLGLLNMRGIIDEWFEYGGDPYFFRIRILEVEDKSLTDEKIQLLERLIDAYKNTRSWLDVINIYITSQGKIYYPIGLTTGEEITVYPWRQTEIETHGIEFFASAVHGIETLVVYPDVKEE